MSDKQDTIIEAAAEAEAVKAENAKTANTTAADTTDTTASDTAADTADTRSNAAHPAGTHAAETDEENDLPPIKKREPLPAWGITSLFIPVSVLLTIAGVILGHIPFFKGGIPTQSTFRYTYMGIGVLLALIGFMLLLRSVSDSQLFLNLKAGKLITTGVYSWTRHPMYAGILFLCTGALFISGNAFFYFLPIVYYFILVHFLKAYEEPFLFVRFGDEYTDYIQKVNRIIPWKKHL